MPRARVNFLYRIPKEIYRWCTNDFTAHHWLGRRGVPDAMQGCMSTTRLPPSSPPPPSHAPASPLSSLRLSVARRRQLTEAACAESDGCAAMATAGGDCGPDAICRDITVGYTCPCGLGAAHTCACTHSRAGYTCACGPGLSGDTTCIDDIIWTDKNGNDCAAVVAATWCSNRNFREAILPPLAPVMAAAHDTKSATAVLAAWQQANRSPRTRPVFLATQLAGIPWPRRASTPTAAWTSRATRV
jgi:hypothetical protein